MAEGWLRELAGDRFEALSAGVDPQGVHPRAVAAMSRAGVDIGQQRSKHIDEYTGDPPELVIAVCGRAAASCPTFPGATEVLMWPFPDPAEAEGSETEIEGFFDQVRDEIRGRIAAWLDSGAAPLGSSG